MDPELVGLAREMLGGTLGADPRQPVGGVLPVGYDIAGDHAVAGFVGFPPDGEWHRTVVLRRDGTTWQPVGGGGGHSSGAAPQSEPDRLAAWANRSTGGVHWPVGAGPLVGDGSGGTLIRSGFWPWSGRYLKHVTVRCAEEIWALEVNGRRRRIPWHGRVLVAWEAGSRLERIGRGGLWVGISRRRPVIAGIGRDGARHVLPDEPRIARRRGRSGRGTASYGPLTAR